MVIQEKKDWNIDNRFIWGKAIMASKNKQQISQQMNYFDDFRKRVSEDDAVINPLVEQYKKKVYREFIPLLADSFEVNDTSDPENVAFFDLSRVVIEDKKTFEEKLKTVYHMFAYTNNSLALIIRRTAERCYLGFAVRKQEEASIEKTIIEAQKIKDAFLGSFPGSNSSDIKEGNKNQPLMRGISENLYNSKNVIMNNSVAIVTNIASKYDEDCLEQGVEKILDGIVPSGENEYTIVMLSESLGYKELNEKKESLYDLYTDFSRYEKKQCTISKSRGRNDGKNSNWNVLIHSWGNNTGNSYNDSESYSTDITQFKAKHYMSDIEKQMERLDNCASFGLYNFSTYVFSTNPDMASEVAHMYRSITQGNDSYYENTAINIWRYPEKKEQISRIAKDIISLRHPRFKSKDFSENNIDDVMAATIISGKEISVAMNMPRKSVPGFSVIECAEFGREISSYNQTYIGDIEIGKIHHMLGDENRLVKLNSNSLSSHAFVTGSTGTGKSNTVCTLLENAQKTFMVIEPTKGEYKFAFGNDVTVYGTNPNLMRILQINPFVFNDGIHVYEHIDRLLDVFNVCWPMYAAMPAVLKEAMIRAYESCGWNLVTSDNKCEEKIYPTFQDVCNQIDEVIESSDYSDENKGNYRGSLKTRLSSLTNGINQLMFCRNNLSDEELFEHNVIIDLSRMGSSENKALVMGLMVIKLQEYRMCSNTRNADLKHITVLEEAHNLLRANTHSTSEASGNIAAKSVEMIANAIAEMRTYGEGFIIVDQAPCLLDMSCIRNTNTKIVMRLPDQSDRELVGRAANLNDEQIKELARLQRGVAAVYQNEWAEAVLCRINKHEDSNTFEYSKHVNEFADDDYFKRHINTCVFNPDYMMNNQRMDFKDSLEKSSINGEEKALLLEYYNATQKNDNKIWQKLAYKYFNINDCVSSINLQTKAEDWIELIKEKLEEYEYVDNPDFDMMRSAAMYRFVQNVTSEAKRRKPQFVIMLQAYANEYKKKFVNK